MGCRLKQNPKLQIAISWAFERYQIELAQAKVDQRVQELQVDLQRHQLQLAELAASLQGIVAPH